MPLRDAILRGLNPTCHKQLLTWGLGGRCSQDLVVQVVDTLGVSAAIGSTTGHGRSISDTLSVTCLLYTSPSPRD